MTNQVERFLFEAVANTCEPDDEGLTEIDWLLEGGAAALEGPTLLLALTDGHIGEDFEGGDYFVLASDYDAAQSELAALREELAEIKESLAYRGSLLNRTQQRAEAADQRNSELVELLDSAFFRIDTFIEAEREMPIPSMEVLRDAILRHCPTLKPSEDDTDSVDCGECPSITDGCRGVCMKAQPTESGASE